MPEFERSAKVVWEGNLDRGKRNARLDERRVLGSSGQLAGARRVLGRAHEPRGAHRRSARHLLRDGVLERARRRRAPARAARGLRRRLGRARRRAAREVERADRRRSRSRAGSVRVRAVTPWKPSAAVPFRTRSGAESRFASTPHWPTEEALHMKATDKIWMSGELVDWADAKVHIGVHGLHYGTGVFEGIRCYETGGRPGRLPAHRPPEPPATTRRGSSRWRFRGRSRSSRRRATS